jgi:hypothetical protein
LLERARAGDFALRGLVAELAESGLKVDHRAVSNFIGARSSISKNVTARECDRPDTTNHRVQRRKYQDTIEIERRVFSDVISTRSGSSSWTIQAAAKPYANFIRVAGVKFIFLPKHASDLDPIEQMIFARLQHVLQHLLRKAPNASSKRSAPQVLESSL